MIQLVFCLHRMQYIFLNRNAVNLAHNKPIKVAVNVSGGEQTFPQIMADFSLFVH